MNKLNSTPNQNVAISASASDGVLCRLTYVSSLNVDSQDFAELLVEKIITQSMKNNLSLKIGGMLYFNHKTFSTIQVLEGPKQDVHDLFYNKIAKDERHTKVDVLFLEDDCKERRYKEWGMLRGRCRDWKILKMSLPSMMEWHGIPLASLDNEDSGDDGTSVMSGTSGDSETENHLRILYKSTLVADGREDAENVMREILQVSHENNVPRRIGGAMTFSFENNLIVQCLEGPIDTVMTLAKTIEADDRHTGFEMLVQEEVSKRIYRDFGMTWLTGDDEESMLSTFPTLRGNKAVNKKIMDASRSGMESDAAPAAEKNPVAENPAAAAPKKSSACSIM